LEGATDSAGADGVGVLAPLTSSVSDFLTIIGARGTAFRCWLVFETASEGEDEASKDGSSMGEERDAGVRCTDVVKEEIGERVEGDEEGMSKAAWRRLLKFRLVGGACGLVWGL
jgi:hypothetical protein